MRNNKLSRHSTFVSLLLKSWFYSTISALLLKGFIPFATTANTFLDLVSSIHVAEDPIHKVSESGVDSGIAWLCASAKR